MTSKAERARNKKLYPRQRQGRTRKEGPRFKSGKLIPERIEPNSVVIERRRILTGIPADVALTAAHVPALKAAENPLDLALFRGWITKKEHEAGEALILLYRKAGMDLPDIRVQDLNRVAKGHSEGLGDASKMRELRKIAEALHCWPKCRAQVFAVCILHEWPKWMIDKVTTGCRGYDGVGRVQLGTGLRIIGKVVGLVEQGRMAA